MGYRPEGCTVALVALRQYLLYSKLALDYRGTQNGPIRPSDSHRYNAGAEKGSISRDKILYYSLATLAFVMAMLAKPTAAAVPVVAWVLVHWLLRRSLRDTALSLIPWIILALPFAVLVKMGQSDINISFVTPLWQRPLITGDALFFYISKLIWPLSLVPDYGRSPEFVLQHTWVYITGLLPYALITFLLWRIRSTILIVSVGTFVAAALPVLGLITFQFQDISTVADRYLYISMLGPALALAGLIARHQGRLLAVCSTLLLLLLAGRTMFQIPYWRDSITLFEHNLSVNPNSWLSHGIIGFTLMKRQGRLTESRAHFLESLRLQPGEHFAKTLNNLGKVSEDMGRFDDAVQYYYDAVRVEPNRYHPHYNLGVLLEKLGKREEAIIHLREAVRVNPGEANAHFNLGLLLERKGEFDEAVRQLSNTLQINPMDAQAHNALGIVLGKRGNLEMAVIHFSEAVRIKPDYTSGYYNLAFTLQKQGRFGAAIENYSKAILIDPDHEDAHYFFGVLLLKQGKLQQAGFHFSEVLRITPYSTRARRALNIVRQRLKVKDNKSNHQEYQQE